MVDGNMINLSGSVPPDKNGRFTQKNLCKKKPVRPLLGGLLVDEVADLM